MRRVSMAIGLLLCLLALPVGAFAQESDEAANFREEAQRAAEEARRVIESLPDPSQILTQASEEQLGQGQPEKEEQFVYSVSPWIGTNFGGTFAPRGVDTIYLIAETDSIVNTQVTEVYYWPITREYMANWFEKREEVDGVLEVLQNGSVVRRFEKTDYAYYFPEGASGPQELLVGEEARRMYDDYQRRIEAYYTAVSEYYEARAEWQRQMDRIIREVQETGNYKRPEEIPSAPTQPSPLRDLVYQPRQAFIINLPAGRYEVRLRGADGQVVPGSERTLDIFAPRRTGTLYRVSPEHKWTRPFESGDPSDTFYLDGRRVFYVEPYHASEYNTYRFVKMANLHKPLEGEGTRSGWLWSRTTPVAGATLQVLKDGEVIESIPYKPYYVKQSPGYALGYQIVEFDPQADPTLEGRSPTFHAYRVELEGDGGYELRLVDGHGNVLGGSRRAIRPVNRPSSSLYLVSSIPLIFGLVLFTWRRVRVGGARPARPAGAERSAVETAAGKDQ